MENKNINEETDRAIKKDDSKAGGQSGLRISLFLFFSVLILLLVCIVGKFIPAKNSFDDTAFNPSGLIPRPLGA